MVLFDHVAIFQRSFAKIQFDLSGFAARRLPAKQNAIHICNRLLNTPNGRFGQTTYNQINVDNM